MSDGIKTSLVDLGEVTKPADTLIKKIAKGVGGFAVPWQIKRVAKAEAEAAIIKAGSDIEVEELQRRAVHRFIEEEAQHQKNMEEITAGAIPLLKEAADAELVKDDWITNFFDKSRIVSDTEMQELWSRILAGEVNEPGSFSKRTVNLMSDFDKLDAELFTKLCGFIWKFDEFIPLIFEIKDKIYRNHLATDNLLHLASIGLLHIEPTSGFGNFDLPKNMIISYHDRLVKLTMPYDEANIIDIGKVVLTQTGQELVRACQSGPVEGFPEYVFEKWKAFDPRFV